MTGEKNMNKIFSNRRGFTLMEIVFVILVIALIVSFALPAFRKVRYDIRNSRAKAALVKLAQARRSFYQTTKGWDVYEWAGSGGTPGTNYFDGTMARNYAAGTCASDNPALTGIPPSSTGGRKEVSQLFACGFLDWRDFEDIPYRFYICSLENTVAAPCNVQGYAGARGLNSETAGKYADDSYWMNVNSNMRLRDSEDGE